MQAALDPIAALATPWGESALAVIRTSGPGSLGRLAPSFRGRASLQDAASHRLYHGVFCAGDEPIDEVVVGVFRAPHSYTGEESVEIYCHGGPAVVRRLLAALRTAGFRDAEPGEFTQRAFLNGRMDLTRAEAVNEIIRARTDRARALALARLSGGIESRVDGAKDRLVDAKAAIEMRLDYPEEASDDPGLVGEGVDDAEAVLRDLLAGYAAGRLFQDGVVVAISGNPNAGKSTLFNGLLREDRAIVSETPGTTRDYIEGTLDIAGVPVRLVDTAGIRDPRDDIEAEGIRRSEQVIASAAFVLHVVDAFAGLTDADARRIATLGDRAVAVWNKVDLSSTPPPPGFHPVSARTGDGLESLRRALADCVLGEGASPAAEALIDSDRQQGHLREAIQAIERYRQAVRQGAPDDMVAFEIDEALRALGEITGESTPEDVLHRLFSRFCVGK
jgi:tRNA modification GTPase